MNGHPRKQLTLLDSTCIIVGIIIGAGIFETAPQAAAALPGWGGVLGLWLGAGLLSLAGALCYAELATAYPREGGDYVYLGRAYGRWAGFLFAWGRVLVVQPADIALMAFVFSRYATSLLGPSAGGEASYAAAAVVALTLVHIAGVRPGKWTQNLLTIAKAAGLLAIFVVAVTAPGAAPAPSAPDRFEWGALSLGLIFVLFTYGGWNEIAFVAAEVRRPQRNILRALTLGVGIVTGLYLLLNAAFLHVLGQERMAASQHVAVDAVAAVLPEHAGRIIAALVCLSALGAANGLILTGARISYAAGRQHPAFSLLGRWSEKQDAPIRALLLQGVICLLIVLLGQTFTNTIIYHLPVVWLFFLATASAVFVLRRREPHTPRPYRVTGYPLTPLVFCGLCAFMIGAGVSYAWSEGVPGPLVSVGILLLGLLVYWLFDRSGDAPLANTQKPQDGDSDM